MQKHKTVSRLTPEENSRRIASMWSRFVDWGKRRKSENGFLIKQLALHGASSVLNAALGDGCDGIYLAKKGFRIIGNEIDKNWRELATKNAKEHGVVIPCTTYDWRSMGFRDSEFDATICLGNSLCMLFDAEERLNAIGEFSRVSGKLLIIDERNYQRILDQREQILSTGNFPYSYRYVYCGREVIGYPVEIIDNRVVFEYRDVRTGETAHLEMYPFKRGELERELGAVFPHVTRFSDYREGFDANADFYQYVATK